MSGWLQTLSINNLAVRISFELTTPNAPTLYLTIERRDRTAAVPASPASLPRFLRVIIGFENGLLWG
jgi:hypothetical protein